MSLISNEPLWRQSGMVLWHHANGMVAGVRLMCLMPRLMLKRRLRFLACGVAVCKSNQAGLIIFIRVVVDGCCKAVHCWRNLVKLHPQVASHFGLRNALVGFELFLEDVPLAKSRGPARSYLKMSPFQPVSRDFAFILDDDVPASQLLRAVKSAAGPLVTDIQLFDVYQGKNIGDGQKSLAVTITLTPQKATLSEAEIEAISDAVIAAAGKNCGAVLRG